MFPRTPIPVSALVSKLTKSIDTLLVLLEEIMVSKKFPLEKDTKDSADGSNATTAF